MLKKKKASEFGKLMDFENSVVRLFSSSILPLEDLSALCTK